MNVKDTLTFHLPEDKGAVYMVWGGVRCQYVHILTWWLWKVEDVLPVPNRMEIFFLFCLPACQSCRGWLMIINHPPAKKNSNSDSIKAFCHLNSSSLAISLWVLCGISHYSQVRLDVWKLIFRYFLQLLFLWHSLRFTRQVKVWLHHHPMAAVSPDGQCVTFESGWCQFG